MAFTIPNEADAFTPAQSELDKVDFDILVAGFAGNGVVSGCVVSQRGAGANMSVDVTVGLCRVAGYWLYSGTATTNVAITTADATNPRFDLVCINYNATISVTAGTPSAAPVFPSIPANSIVLAAVYVPANDTAITTAQCIDKRAMVADSFDLQDDFTGGSGSSGFIGNLNWSESVSGASTSPVSGESNHPGIYASTVGPNSSNYATQFLARATTNGIIVPSSLSRMRTVFKTSNITNSNLKIGLLTDAANLTQGSAGTAGVWLELYPGTNANYRAYTREAGTSSSALDTGVAGATNTWVNVDIVRLQNGNYQIAINQSLKGTITTNLPTTATNIGWVSTVSASSTTVTFSVDFVGLSFAPLARY